MHKKLFIPGPVEVTEDVLQKMATPMIGHRTKDASMLQKSISKKMMKVMYTNNQIILSTTSGSGLMEGAVRSCTRRKAAIFSIGAFGDRWYKMAISNGIEADIFPSEPGGITTAEMLERALSSGDYDLITITHNETSTGVMNPLEVLANVWKKYPDVVVCVDTVSSMGGTKIEVDNLGIDICITSTQKCLGLPPGMSICSFSPKAIEVAKNVKFRGTYLDLLGLYEYIQKRNYQYPSTPSISHMFALDYQLDKILAEGLENRFARHLEMAVFVREWAKKHFALFPEEKYASNTVTAIRNTRNIDIGELNKKLGEQGFMISNGYGQLKDITFRIAHMAEASLDEIKELLYAIEGIIGL